MRSAKPRRISLAPAEHPDIQTAMTITVKRLTPDTFLSPLAVFRLEHDHQFATANWLLEVAEIRQLESLRDEVESLLTFLTQDLFFHHKDEEDDLFPMLRFRCEPQDGIDGILAKLDRDHATEHFLVLDIAVDLNVLVDGREMQDPARFFQSLRFFAKGQQRHLSWENQAVLPLADKRLTAKDLDALGRNMAARRGIAYPS